MSIPRLVSAHSWSTQLSSQQSTPPPTAPSCIDAYFEDAYEARGTFCFCPRGWLPPRKREKRGHRGSSSSSITSTSTPYWWMIGNIGLACSIGAVQMWFVSFVLTDEDFVFHMLRGDGSFLAGVLAASLFFGMLVGGVGAGAVADATGRKPVLLAGLGLSFVSDIATAALCRGTGGIMFAQFATGVGVGATIPSVFTLATELSPPSRRGRMVTIVATCWVLGASYVSVAAIILLGRYGLSWRYFAAVCALPSLFTACINAFCVPESPRYLALKGRYRAAALSANCIADKLGCGEGMPDPLTVEDIRGMFSTTKTKDSPDRSTSTRKEADIVETKMMEEGEAASLLGNHSRTVHLYYSEERYERKGTNNGHILNEPRTKFRPASDIVALYSSDLWRITLPLSTLWFALCFGCYGLLTWITSIFESIHLADDVYYSTLLFALSELPGDLLSTVLIDKVGRVPLLFWSMLLSALSLASFGLFAALGADKHATAVVASACLFQTFSTGLGWNALDTLTGEVFPTRVRSTGVGVCNAYGRVGPIVAQFVNGMLVRRPVILIGVSGGMLGVATLMTVVLWDKEMSGRPLSENVGFATDSVAVVSFNNITDRKGAPTNGSRGSSIGACPCVPASITPSESVFSEGDAENGAPEGNRSHRTKEWEDDYEHGTGTSRCHPYGTFVG